MTSRAIDTVLFDLYDTLVVNDWSAHIVMVADRIGVPPTDVRTAYDESRDDRDGGAHTDAAAVMKAVLATCGVEPTSRLVEDLVAAEADLLASSAQWYEDSVPYLRRLRADGYRTGVISNCSPSSRPVVERLGVEGEADVVILSYEVGASKPSPRIFQAALDAVGAEAETAIFVDDRADYLDGAAALGMRTVRIARPVAHGEDTAGGEHPVVTDLGELDGILRLGAD